MVAPVVPVSSVMRSCAAALVVELAEADVFQAGIVQRGLGQRAEAEVAAGTDAGQEIGEVALRAAVLDGGLVGGVALRDLLHEAAGVSGLPALAVTSKMAASCPPYWAGKPPV